ncbi:hydroxyectoine utilization dehydratase EutB [Hoeflea sp.]|uniref:hydroxyectoine utilization dehydratase EutB n=1 Tax=Hoeflea sp. TaxID=1940281 RepID=UPI003B523521
MNEPVDPVGLGEILSARGRISGTVRQTPVQLSTVLSERTGVPVHLKLEHTQITGSFKFRGASNAVESLSDEERRRGVIGVSTGNHGRGLAYAAKTAGVKCIICMSKLVPQAKIDGIRAQGAEVRIIGKSQDEAQLEVDRLVWEEGMTMIPPFDHRDVIAGQGTLGLEFVEQVPELETVLVPVSGGGLVSGVAAALKARKPGIRVVGVSMERGAAMHACLAAGRPVEVEELATLADSLGGGIGLENRFTFMMTRDLVDDLVLVTETEIAEAIRHIYWEERQIVEGSGAVGVAALLSGKVGPSGVTGIIVSGGNIDMKQHHRIISGENVDVTREVA